MHACEPGIPAAAAVEVDGSGIGGAGEGAGAVVADAAGFEGAGGLKVVEFEEYSAAID